MGANRSQRIQNCFQHGFSFLKYLVVPEPEDAIALRFNSTVATHVIALAFLMLSAIELDYESCFETCEIGDIAAHWRLASETKPANLAAPEMSPKVQLSVRCLIS